MKVRSVVFLGVILGIALGAGITWINFGSSPPLFAKAPERKDSLGNYPRIRVDKSSHNFGAIERDVKVRHAFHVTNVGKATLNLKAGVTTCTKCTIAELKKTSLEPGESTDVLVEYSPSAGQPKFHQIAPILTNDPDQPRVEFFIHGTVTARFRVAPEDLILSRFSNTETKTAEIKIYALLADDVHLVGDDVTEADTAEYFKVESEPIPRDQITEADVKSGCRVTVTIKPGLPLGSIHQTIRLRLALGDSPQTSLVEIPVRGTVDAGISVVGAGWDQDESRLTIGYVKSAKGAKRTLLVLVRGDHHADVKITPAKVDPAWMKVEVGEPSELRSGAVTQIPLTIEIPPGQPPVNHLGYDQGAYGEIVLDTTHAEVKKIRMYVKFIVEQ
ncbi:MAG TPA: DUF1573 domain-containing protein [Pirellulales bacterium]|jgi:hypothetical protein|nr:DUF1573 domain-containing protein [Pirellulales bacterium]